jgi:hypothetical protein
MSRNKKKNKKQNKNNNGSYFLKDNSKPKTYSSSSQINDIANTVFGGIFYYPSNR